MNKYIKIKGWQYSNGDGNPPAGRYGHRMASRGRRIAVKRETRRCLREYYDPA